MRAPHPHSVAASTAKALASAFGAEVLEGLARRRKSIPCTWLYDRRGVALFERITEVPEYYVWRAEALLLERAAEAIAQAIGPRAVLVELGSGASRKTPILLGALDRPLAYRPIDLSAEILDESARRLRERFPGLHVEPLRADFTTLDALPPAPGDDGPCAVFFPGATIGNFTPDEAAALLTRIARLAGPRAHLIVGADHTRDPARLVRAYDDAAGITAEFNRNLLVRINRELGGDFDPTAFRHVACFNPGESRVEMHLVSERAQRVHVLGRAFEFEAGESIHTENAYKPSLFQFLALAHRAGWTQRQLWMDAAAGYAVHVLENVSLP
jgi:L-histidine Nalpha-methyltransferase